jgi:hypothetical protein
VAEAEGEHVAEGRRAVAESGKNIHRINRRHASGSRSRSKRRDEKDSAKTQAPSGGWIAAAGIP